MGLLSIAPPVDGADATAASVTTPLNAIVGEFNGKIDNANMSPTAAIAGSKLAQDGSVLLGTHTASPTAPLKVRVPIVQASGATTTGDFGVVPSSWLWLDPADYTVSGKTAKFRIYVVISRGNTTDLLQADLFDPGAAARYGTAVVSIDGAESTTVLGNRASTTWFVRSAEQSMPATARALYLRLKNVTTPATGGVLNTAWAEVYWV